MFQIFNMYSKYFFYFFMLSILFLGLKKASSKSDFHDYYSASKLFSEKKDLYNKENLMNLKKEISVDDFFKSENFTKLNELKGNIGTYIYPPLFAFLLIPISYFDYSIASSIFNISNWICLVSCFYLLKQKYNSSNIYFIFCITFILSFKYLENHSVNNQVAFILLFLSLYSVLSKNEILSGLSLSLAIWIKITPAIFLLFFLLNKDFKKIFYTFIFGICWMFLPSVYNHEYNLVSLMDWKELVLDNAMKNPEFRSWKNNQSLISTLAKYFLPSADFLNQSEYHLPILSLSKQILQYIFYVLAILIWIPFGFSIFKKQNKEKNISILFILSILFSGISWIHSFVFLLFPIFYLTKYFLEEKQNSLLKKIFILISFLSILISKNIIGLQIESFLLMYSYLLYLSLAYYLILININSENDSTQV